MSTSNSDNAPLEKITNTSGIYSIDDFLNTGFKVVKEYDVSELEDSSGVWFGFWKNDPHKSIVLDYEIRTYPSHQLALDKGVKYVEEVIGEEAILGKSLSSWKEGIQHRSFKNIKYIVCYASRPPRINKFLISEIKIIGQLKIIKLLN